MRRTSSIAAYLAWALALAAILMPPALAAAGLETVASLRNSVFALVGDGPEPLAVAGYSAEKDGWHA